MITLTINAATLDEARAQFNAFISSGESASTPPPPPLKFPVPAAPVAPPAAPPQMAAPVAPTPGAIAPPAPAMPAMPTAPAVPAVPAVPAAPAPAYSEEDLGRAAAALIDAGKMADLQALLQTFGIRFIGELPAERRGEFAAALRSMGAKL